MIIGSRVVLDGITKESSSTILKWANDPELKHQTGTLYPISEYEHEEWLKIKLISSNDKLFLIKDKETNINIGTIGLKNMDFVNSNVELFISIGEHKYLSNGEAVHGYGSDAVKVLTDFCFNRLNLHKVYLHVFSSNKRAKMCYEKAGFKIEGNLREHHYDGGKFEDVVIMSIIK